MKSTDRVNYIKCRTSVSKDAIKKEKREATPWEKISAMLLADEV